MFQKKTKPKENKYPLTKVKKKAGINNNSPLKFALIFAIPSVGWKKRHNKNPRPLCWTVSELIPPPSLACQHLEASRWGNRYLRCSVWNLYVLDEGVCVFCRKVISCWWLEEIRLDTELRLVLNNLISHLFTRSFAHTNQVVLWDFWTNNDVSFTKNGDFSLGL